MNSSYLINNGCIDILKQWRAFFGEHLRNVRCVHMCQLFFLYYFIKKYVTNAIHSYNDWNTPLIYDEKFLISVIKFILGKGS